MDPVGGSIFSTLFITFVVISLIYCIKWLVQRRKRMNIFKENGLPSAPAGIIFGNLDEFFDDFITFYDKCFSQYGNVFGYFFGKQPTLVVNDLEVLKHVLVKDFNNFRDRPEMLVQTKPLCDSVAFINGPRWKETRSILGPCFSSKKLRSMYNLMNESVTTFVDIIGEKSKAGTSIDIHGMSEALSMDVINKCALALKRDCQTNREDELLTFHQGIDRRPFGFLFKLVLSLPVIAKAIVLLITFSSKSKKRNFTELNLRDVIAFRRKNSANRFTDMLQLMLDANENKDGGENSSKKSMTDDELVANAMIFIFAGFGTTSNALSFTFYLLAKHQDIQDKLRKEINEHLQNESPDSYEAINSVDYLDQVLHESLRMYPPITNFITRQCTSDITINGLTIPKGVTVEVPVYHIQHDPKIWPNPEEFDPSRFSAENKQNIKPMEFLAFGAGPRNCIGMRFALMEAKLTICRAIQKYKFVFSEKTEDPLRIRAKIGISPASGYLYLNAIEL